MVLFTGLLALCRPEYAMAVRHEADGAAFWGRALGAGGCQRSGGPASLPQTVVLEALADMTAAQAFISQRVD